MDQTLSAITIRPLRRSDLPTVHKILVDTYHSNHAYASHSDLQMGVVPGKKLTKENEEYLKDHVACHVGRRDYAGFAATDRERIIGVVLIRRHRPKGAASYGELSDLLLRPKQKSEGIGQMLIARALAQFKAWNVPQVFLETGLRNKSAHRFFIGQGWQPVSHTLRISTQLPNLHAAPDAIPSPDSSTESHISVAR